MASSTPFAVTANNVTATIVLGGYTSGSGVLQLTLGQGARFPSLSGSQSYRLSVFEQSVAYSPLATSAQYTIFKATGLTTDTFSGVTAIEGTTDRNYVGGDVVEIRGTAASFSDVYTAVNNIESSPYVTSLNAHSFCSGRLTLTSLSPLAYNTSGTTVYYTPYYGNSIALYDGSSKWNILQFSEASIAVPGSTGLYDVFAYNNSGTMALELSSAWSVTGNLSGVDGTRTNALVLQDGIYVKSGATTRRYLGTIYSNSGTTYDNYQFRYLWNLYNQTAKRISVQETTANWTYSTNAWRPINNNANGKSYVQCVVGISGMQVSMTYGTFVTTNTGLSYAQTGFSYDSTTSPRYDYNFQLAPSSASGVLAGFSNITDIGLHSYYLMEFTNGNSVTFYGSGYQGMGGAFVC